MIFFLLIVLDLPGLHLIVAFLGQLGIDLPAFLTLNAHCGSSSPALLNLPEFLFLFALQKLDAVIHLQELAFLQLPGPDDFTEVERPPLLGHWLNGNLFVCDWLLRQIGAWGQNELLLVSGLNVFLLGGHGRHLQRGLHKRTALGGCFLQNALLRLRQSHRAVEQPGLGCRLESRRDVAVRLNVRVQRGLTALGARVAIVSLGWARFVFHGTALPQEHLRFFKLFHQLIVIVRLH